MRSFCLLGACLALFACDAPSSQEDDADSSEDAVQAAPQPQTCGLGWGESPDSFAGVEGTFGRAGTAASGEMKILTLSNVVQASAHISSEGDATLTSECGSTACPAENVRASLLPTNAAMNPMIMLSANGFATQQPDMRGAYNVLGIERTANGEIDQLCLFRIDAQPASDPFVMKRR
jgi:hypothetical protein